MLVKRPARNIRQARLLVEDFDLELAWFDTHPTEAVLEGPTVSLGLWRELRKWSVEYYVRLG